MVSIPQHESPYDLLLDALNPAIAQENKVQIKLLPDEFDGDMAEELAVQLVRHETSKSVQSGDIQIEHSIDHGQRDNQSCYYVDPVQWLTSTWILLHRTFLIKLRDPICLVTQISSAILMGVIFGLLYYDVYDKSEDSFAVLDAQMCIALTVMMTVFLPYDVTLTFPMERKIFLRERKAGLYPTSSFYIARITADVPAHVVSSIFMSIIVWGMAGLRIAAFDFILVNIAGILIGAAMMQCIGAIARTFEEANIYMMIVMMMSMMLGTGFVREVPSFLSWARDISVMGVLADIAMYLEFKDVPAKYGTPQSIYEEYGVRINSDSDLDTGVMVLLVIFLICRVFCYVFVKFMFTGRTVAENLKD